MKTALVLLLLFLSGCVGTSAVRVVETGGGGAAGLFAGDVGSCAVHQNKGDDIYADITLTYAGQKCSVEIKVRK